MSDRSQIRKAMATLEEAKVTALQKLADRKFGEEEGTPEQRLANYLRTPEGAKAKAAFDEVPQKLMKMRTEGAYRKIQDAAAELRKKDASLTEEQAIAKIITTHPEMVEEYRRTEASA